MRKEFNTEEIINALEIVEQIISDNCQMIDYFYSGDKDTRFEAMRNILEKHSLPNFDTLTSKEREKYHNEYSDEISKEYTRLVEFGHEEFNKCNISWKYIKKLREMYQNHNSVINTDNDDRIEDIDIDETDLPF